MKERLKAARKKLGLSQTEFGARLGVTDGAISRLEKGGNKLTEQMIIAVCREFGIDETYLRTGDGEMFSVSSDTLIEQLKQMGFDALSCKFIKVYKELPADHRSALNEYLIELFDSLREELNKQDEAEPERPAEPELTIEEQANAYAERKRDEAYKQYMSDTKWKRETDAAHAAIDEQARIDREYNDEGKKGKLSS